MKNFPAAVIDFLIRRSIEFRSAAYLVLDERGSLRDSGGQLSAYGLGNLKNGQEITSVVYFLEGILPLKENSLDLHCLETATGLMADLHLFRQDTQTYVVLMEAVLSPLQQRQVQQQNYEMQLDREKRAKLLEQQLGHEPQSTEVAEDVLLGEEGGRRTVTLLTLFLRMDNSQKKTPVPNRLFSMMSNLLDQAIQAVYAYGGMIDRINRQSMTAIFGFGDSRLHPTQHAISAAAKFLDSIHEIHQRHSLVKAFPNAGVGIATGAVNIGMLKLNQKRILTVYGEPVDLAERLAIAAQPSQILLDQDSFTLSMVHAPKFAEVTTRANQDDQPLYAWQVSRPR